MDSESSASLMILNVLLKELCNDYENDARRFEYGGEFRPSNPL